MPTIKSVMFVLVAIAGCQQNDAPSSPNDLGLKMTAFDDGHVAGHLSTTVGAVDFTVYESQPGQVEVQFDRGAGPFGSSVDWNAMTADFAWPAGMQFTEDDKFVLSALAVAAETELGKDTLLTDNLFRQASLWGAHPVGDIVLGPIVGDPNRSWTTLCSAGACNSSAPSRGFTHSGGSTERNAPCGNHPSTNKTYTRKFGKADTINPCLSRCGAGCDGIGTSAWTQDCGNHDICEYWHTSDCGGELTSASDDFTFAPNCSC
jgi:hypothetical protein